MLWKETLESLSWKELEALCKAKGIKAWRRVPTGNTVKRKKEDLIADLMRQQEASQDKDQE